MGKMKALAIEIEEYKQLLAERAMDEMAGFNGTTHDDFDMVNKPKHYQIMPGLEVYDLRQALAKKAQELGIPHDQFSDWDRALEYLLRMWEKNKRQDLQKAMFYMNKLLEKLPEEVSVSGVPYKVPSSSILSNGV